MAVLGALVYAHLPTGGGRQLDTAHAALFTAGILSAFDLEPELSATQLARIAQVTRDARVIRAWLARLTT